MTRICIDGYNLALPQGTGVATYGFSLATTLQAMGHTVDGLFGLETGGDAATREVLFFEQFGGQPRRRGRRKWPVVRRMGGAIASLGYSVKVHEVPLTGRIERRAFASRFPGFNRLWNASLLFRAGEAYFKAWGRPLTIDLPERPDIMHWTYPLPVRVRGAKNVYTLHDLVPLRLPYTTMDNKQYYYDLIKSCVQHGDHVCTVSQASYDDVVERFPAVAERMTNTYQIAPIPSEVLSCSPEENARIVERMFGLRRREYFLFFGALDPKKNLARIVEAHLTAGVDLPLVIVASRDPGEDDKKVFGQGHASSGKIVHLEYLPRTTLLRLAQGARALLFPSLYEGFGLPVLEALQLGTPVISANVSSLPEVAGDAGILVDPYSVEDISRAIVALNDDPALWERLAAAAPAQVAKFSVGRYQERLADLYNRVLASAAT